MTAMMFTTNTAGVAPAAAAATTTIPSLKAVLSTDFVSVFTNRRRVQRYEIPMVLNHIIMLVLVTVTVMSVDINGKSLLFPCAAATALIL